ncbi:MAG TPA: DMT family transporter [Bryobacteraceae bacterium]|nr:DMT family transporter [Bryobacteraceae bacterium]HOQ44101.1 DMT family transporter [Bryobacteraceae bacterium]HPU70419.1 DMT family transporter [Bryobacteraceae bacterium]
MKVHLYVLTMFLGVILAVHLAMNGKVGAVLNNARIGNALFWCIGAAGAVLIGLTGWRSGALAPLKEVHPALFTAGILGATLVFAIAWLIPQVGAGPVMITLLAGQVLGGLIMSHFGWLGSPVQPITLAKVIGVLVMVGGVAIATYSK